MAAGDGDCCSLVAVTRICISEEESRTRPRAMESTASKPCEKNDVRRLARKHLRTSRTLGGSLSKKRTSFSERERAKKKRL